MQTLVAVPLHYRYVPGTYSTVRYRNLLKCLYEQYRYLNLISHLARQRQLLLLLPLL
jgi:hypothetical protein